MSKKLSIETITHTLDVDNKTLDQHQEYQEEIALKKLGFEYAKNNAIKETYYQVYFKGQFLRFTSLEEIDQYLKRQGSKLTNKNLNPDIIIKYILR